MLFLAISSSIDSFGIGITYGIRNTKISNSAKLILFVISFVFPQQSSRKNPVALLSLILYDI